MKIKSCFVVFFTLLGITLYAQGPYFIPVNSNIPVSATAINSMDVETADVDDDGDLDIVIAGEYQRNLLFFNDGTGNFSEDATRLFPEKNVVDGFPGEDSEDIAFADFNQDGDIDVLFVSEDTAFHELLINDGNGGFSFIAFEFQASAGNAVTIIDLNNDDFPDIIIGNTGQNHVYINNQDLTFTQENNRWPVNTEGTQDLKQIDLDDDGDMDIVEGIDLGSNNILINEDGFFSEENNRLPTTGLTIETRKVSLGDVNGDTYPDIFLSTVNFTGTANLQNRLYLNDGNGFFSDATQTHLPVYIRNTLDAVFLDYDNDDDLDLITTDFQNPVSSYHAFENDGAGIFTETTNDVFQAFNFNNGITIHAADFNEDTYIDLYFGNFQETDDILFFDPETLGSSDENIVTDSILTPNPVANEFLFDSKLDQHYGNLLFTLYDSKGNKVKEIKGLTTNQGRLQLKINVSKLSSGLYIYRLSSNDTHLLNGKMIKK